MRIVVPVKNVLPNPYQARKKMDREGIRALADEIRENGLWVGALRGRMKGDKVELCFGHRRLAALKSLGWTEVEVEVAELTDEDMAGQGLAENMQREGLTDIEKAEGIHMMLQRLIRAGTKETDAFARVSRLLGLSSGWIKDLLSLLALEKPVQKAIREKVIAGRTALEAHRLGGKEMVQTAIDKKLPVHKISALAQKLRRIPDEEVRERVKADVIRGRVVVPEQVQEKARVLLKGRKPKPPSDLDRLLGEWVARVRQWSTELDELMLYKRFLAEPGRADVLKSEVQKLSARLQRLTS
ncbi:MAG: ParB/RepB/Spo0J family partition protein [Planctomycetes bacterium]|nr:ParB/RepB/Spo0J family partition protein [Planctomycetota bacterium]